MSNEDEIDDEIALCGNLLLFHGTGRDTSGISRPVPPTNIRDSSQTHDADLEDMRRAVAGV